MHLTHYQLLPSTRRKLRLRRVTLVSLEENQRKGEKRTYRESSRHSSPSGVHLPSTLRRRSPGGDASSLSHRSVHRVVPRFHFHSAPSLVGLGRGSRHLPSSASTRVHRESISRNRCLTPLPPPPHHPQVVNTRTNAFLTHTRTWRRVRIVRFFSRVSSRRYPFSRPEEGETRPKNARFSSKLLVVFLPFLFFFYRPVDEFIFFLFSLFFFTDFWEP